MTKVEIQSVQDPVLILNVIYVMVTSSKKREMGSGYLINLREY